MNGWMRDAPRGAQVYGRRPPFAIGFAAITSMLLACSSGNELQDAAESEAVPEAQLRAEVAQVAEEMVAAVRARDPDRVVSFYDRSSFVHYEDGAVVSWAELEPQMRTFMGSASRLDLSWTGAPTVVLLGPDAALVYGIHRFEGVLQDGTALPSHTGTWSGVLRRSGGTWKLIHSHSSESGS
jgi:ketosteroid isomerase-like protein